MNLDELQTGLMALTGLSNNELRLRLQGPDAGGTPSRNRVDEPPVPTTRLSPPPMTIGVTMQNPMPLPPSSTSNRGSAPSVPQASGKELEDVVFYNVADGALQYYTVLITKGPDPV